MGVKTIKEGSSKEEARIKQGSNKEDFRENHRFAPLKTPISGGYLIKSTVQNAVLWHSNGRQ